LPLRARYGFSCAFVAVNAETNAGTRGSLDHKWQKPGLFRYLCLVRKQNNDDAWNFEFYRMPVILYAAYYSLTRSLVMFVENYREARAYRSISNRFYVHLF